MNLSSVRATRSHGAMVIVLSDGSDAAEPAAADNADVSRMLLRLSVRIIRSRLTMDEFERVRGIRKTILCIHKVPIRSGLPFAHPARGCYESNVPLQHLTFIEKDPPPRKIARPHMVTYDARLQSFGGNNSEFAIARDLLASHGFFSVSSDDDVTQCFYCGAIMANWTVSDIPIREHRRLAPDCYYAVALHDLLRRQTGLMYGSLNRVSFVRVLIPDKRRRSLHNPFERAYEDSTIREASFRGRNGERWKWDSYEPAHMMAEIGFVFIGSHGWKARRRIMQKVKGSDLPNISDAVQCFSCGYVFYDWNHGKACPWTEHASWSNNCKYLRRSEQQTFIIRAPR